MDRRRLFIIYYKLNKTNMLSAKISREFNNNPLHQLIHLGHLKIRILAQGYCVAMVRLTLL